MSRSSNFVAIFRTWGAKLTREFAAKSVRYPNRMFQKPPFQTVRYGGRSKLTIVISAFRSSALKFQCRGFGGAMLTLWPAPVTVNHSRESSTTMLAASRSSDCSRRSRTLETSCRFVLSGSFTIAASTMAFMRLGCMVTRPALVADHWRALACARPAIEGWR